MARLTARVTYQGIVLDGLWVNASVPRLTYLKQHGEQIPQPERIHALIDTGATISWVDAGVVERLGLTPTGFINVHTSFSGDKPEKAGLFDVSLWFGQPTIHPLTLTLPVGKADLSRQTIQCLIGMDILRKCELHLDGPNQTAELIYPVDA